MELVYATVALAVGVGLVCVSAVSAYVYTPLSGSLVDTLMTAFTGTTLQLGNLIAVSGVVAIAFQLLATGGVVVPLPVPVVLAYASSHLTIYVSCLKITTLQERPLDPEAVDDFAFRSLVPGLRFVSALRSRVTSR